MLTNILCRSQQFGRMSGYAALLVTGLELRVIIYFTECERVLVIKSLYLLRLLR